MTIATKPNCQKCGKPLPNSGLGAGECRWCLLSLGLDSDGRYRPSRVGSAAESSDGSSRDSFLQVGVLPEFGDYELVSEIARGGMGVVYRARQRSLNRIVAVKLILAGQLATPDSVRRFQLEAEAAARLDHPAIVPIYEIGEVETQHFYSMKLIEGVSLAECRDEFAVDPAASVAETRLQEVCIAELILRVARALEYAHQHGILHRDLKPSNILIDQDGLPHLTDFGLAKLTDGHEGNLTFTQTVLGTPGYLSPEQAAGNSDITTGADIYGLGAILYELLTRRPPFVGANAVETMWMAVHNEPPAPRKIVPTVDRDLETIALRCLEKKPENRYSTAAEVAEELQRFVRREPIKARPVSKLESLRRWCLRRPRTAILAGSFLTLLVVGSAMVAWQWRRAERANVELTENVAHLKWMTIDNMIDNGQSSRGLAIVASLLRNNRHDRKAAMFGMSLVEQRRFPLPRRAADSTSGWSRTYGCSTPL